jgi:predicted enzyme related to lactoylglutathione lyase
MAAPAKASRACARTRQASNMAHLRDPDGNKICVFAPNAG